MYNQLLYCCIFFLLSCSSTSKTQIDDNITDPYSTASDYFSFNPPLELETKPENLKFKLNTIDQGEISETGLVLGNITYSMRIRTIDSTTLLSMPQMKIEDEHLYIPNLMISKNPKD